MSAREPQSCDTPNGEHSGRSRLYPCGWRCSAHAPWAEAGLPEPLPGPGLPEGLPLSPISASRITDERAIASGKRRSSPATYRAAQAAVNHRKDTN
jgi:hypothetical protein